jgi:hypothetical protein
MRRHRVLAKSCSGVAASSVLVARGRPFSLGLVVMLLFMLPVTCRADFLPIVLDQTKEIILDFNGRITYDATTDDFHSVSTALSYSPAPQPSGFAFFTAGSTVTIDLSVDNSGKFIAGGTGFNITGGLDLDGDGRVDVSGDLLDGTITNFGGKPAGPPTWVSDGTFTVTGGLLTNPMIALGGGGTWNGGFPVGALGGFLLFAENATSGTLGDFSQDFSSGNVKSNEGLAVSVPEPATWTLTATALGLLSSYSLRRRQHRRRLAMCRAT